MTPLVDAKAFAAFCGVSTYTVQEWARRGIVPRGVLVRLPGSRLLRFDMQRAAEWAAAGGAVEATVTPIKAGKGGR